MMQERRWLEIERRMRWCELQTFTIENILRLAYEKINEIWDAVPPPSDGGVDPPPVNPCPGGVYPVVFDPDWGFGTQIVTVTQECNNFPPINNTLHYDGTQGPVKKLTHKVIYDGIETITYQKSFHCSGSTVDIELVNFKIDPYDPEKPVVMCYEYEYHADGEYVFTDDGLKMVNPDGTYYGQSRYLGKVPVTVNSGYSPASLCRSILPEDIPYFRPDCSIHGPFLSTETIPDVLFDTIGSFSVPDAKFDFTFKLTLVDYQVTEQAPTGSYPDQTYAAQWATGIYDAYLNKSAVMRYHKPECSTLVEWDYSELSLSYDDRNYVRGTIYPVKLSGISACRVVETKHTLPCDAGEVAENLSTPKVQATGSILARGYGVTGDGSAAYDPNFPNQNWNGKNFDFGISDAILNCIGLVPVDSAVSQEWWTSEITVYTARSNPNLPGFKTEGYTKIKSKWKFEGPF